MSNPTEYTGRLENWFYRSFLGQTWVEGNVYDDAKGRFRKGAFIHTSMLVEIDPENKVANTTYSKYLLGVPKFPDPSHVEEY